MEEANDPTNLNIKFYKMSPVNENQPLPHYNKYAVSKLLPTEGQGLVEIKPFSKTSFLLKLRVNSQAEQHITGMKVLPIGATLVPVTVSELEEMNTSKGTIYAPDLSGTPLEEVIQESPQITHIEQLTKWNATKQVRETIPAYKITFNSRRIPETVNIGYSRYYTRQYYDAPRGCLACLSYEHLFRSCPVKEKIALCRKCGLNAGLDQEESQRQNKRILRKHDCQDPPICPLCPAGENEHRPTAAICPFRRKEVEIIRLKTDQQLSYSQAKARVTDSYVSSHRSFAQVSRGATAGEQGPSTSMATLAKNVSDAQTNLRETQRLKRQEQELRQQLIAEEAELDALIAERQAREERIRQKRIYLATLAPLQDDSDMAMVSPLQDDSDLDMDDTDFKAPTKPGTKRGRINPTLTQQSSTELSPQAKRKETGSQSSNSRPQTPTMFKFVQFDPVPEGINAPYLNTEALKTVKAGLSPEDRTLMTNATKAEPPQGYKKPVRFRQHNNKIHAEWTPNRK